MAGSYSVDLRQRVIDAIEGGVPGRAVARRFAIGESTAGAWHRRWRATGEIRPGRRGGRAGSKLDAFEGIILGLVEARRDITLVEIAESLEAEHGLRTCRASLCNFFKKRRITYKKRRRTLPNRTARM